MTLCDLPVLQGDLKDGDRIFSRACSDRRRENGCKVKESIFRSDRKMKLFVMRVKEHWNRLPRGVVDAPTLGNIQGQVGWMRNLIYVEVSLLTAETPWGFW